MRDVYFDNLRAVAVSLVIAGHLIEPATSKIPWAKALFLAIYAFHVPLVVFISGRYASAVLDRRALAAIGSKLLLPYVILEVLYTVGHHVMFGKGAVTIGPLTPYWVLWYLVSLATWRVLLPVWLQTSRPIILSFALALAIGVSNEFGTFLSLSRTLVFFPFFLLGHLTRSADFRWLSERRWRLAAVAVLVGFVVATLWPSVRGLDVKWFHGSVSYDNLGKGLWVGALGRAAALGVAILGGLSVMALVPRQRFWWSGSGSRSLYPYLLHVVIVKGAIAFGFYKGSGLDGRVVAAIVCAPIAYVALASDAVTRLVGPILSPRVFGRWFFRRSDNGIRAGSQLHDATSG